MVDDWEGKVNAWPLDEGLIDYVDASYGGPSDEDEFAALNVIANATFTLSGTKIDATEITPDLLEKIALAAVYRIQPCAIDGNQVTAKQIKAKAQDHKLTEDFPKGRFILAPVVSDGF
jgi:uncharacterized iron-regulated protein